MKSKKHIFTAAVAMLASLYTSAQQIMTNSTWYLSGENMIVMAAVPYTETASSTAYAELSCNGMVVAGGVMKLSKHDFAQQYEGYTLIKLPINLHSDTYTLAVYARDSKKAYCKTVSIINPLYSNPQDNIKWIADNTTCPENSQKSFSVDITSNPFTQYQEPDGHVVMARIRNAAGQNVHATLSVVGEQVHVFDGKIVNDSTAAFFTYGVYNNQPIVLSASTEDGKVLPISIVSPFINVCPVTSSEKVLFHYTKEKVEKMSVKMQERLLCDTTDVLPYSNEIFGTEPRLSYNLDEYHPFKSIKEVFTEYVRDIRHSDNHLYVYNENEGYSEWSALVLLDGMPVTDIDALLAYDARRVHYINLYSEHYRFGKQMYKGIVSIVTRTGKLTNFAPTKESQYLVYSFPQNF